MQTHQSALACCGVCRILGVCVGDRDAAVVLLYSRHLCVVLNDVADFPGKRFADRVHAADRLKHRGLEGMQRKILQIAPEPRFEDIRQIDHFARNRRRAEATARILGVTTKISRNEIRLVSVVAIQRAP